MKIFKDVMAILCRHFATFGLGWSTADLLTGDYKSAAWVLFVVSIMFMVGYFAERWTNEDF